MADVGMIFSGPMVRALLDGRKTVTRRFRAPRVGDTIWVRETWAAWRSDELITHPTGGSWATEVELNGYPAVEYRADYEPRYGAWERPDGPGRIMRVERWLSPLHLPRWASRITRRVVSVESRQLHDIDDDDARREGVADRAEFEALWRGLHGAESWDLNPWLWRIEVCHG